MTSFKISHRVWFPILLLLVTLAGSLGLVLRKERTAMEMGRTIQIQSTVDSALGIVRSFQARALAGEMTEEEAKVQARNSVRAMTYDGNNYVFVYDREGTVLTNAPDVSVEGTNRMDVVDPNGVPVIRRMVEAVRNGGTISLNYAWARGDDPTPQPKASYAAGFAPWGWTIGTGVYMDDIDRAFWKSLGELALVLIPVLAVVLGIVVLGTRAITRPLGAMTQRMRLLADGDLTVTVEGADRKDEIGDMARALAIFREKGLENERMRTEQAEAEIRMTEDRHRTRTTLANAFEQDVGSLVTGLLAASEDLHTAAQSMGRLANDADSRAEAVAHNTEAAAGNVHSVAAAAEELAASIAEIGRQVARASEVTNDAVVRMAATTTRMDALVDSSERIGEVVNLITDIAEQTNLLALNATIEAARAGDAGKGFAVVANEVKSLANQTARATDEISRQITDLQGQTRGSGEAIQAITSVVSEINEISQAIAAAVEEQSVATRDISRNIQQASDGTARVSESIAGVLTDVHHTGAAAAQVGESAGGMRHSTEELRERVVDFVTRVRAG
jgi:methyl-accepting chemotaxis protein